MLSCVVFTEVDSHNEENGHSRLLREKREWLVNNIEVKGSLLDRLYQDGVVTDEERDDVNNGATRHEKVRRLLDKVNQKSKQDFGKFLQALRNTNQKHVVDKFSGTQFTEVYTMSVHLKGLVSGI